MKVTEEDTSAVSQFSNKCAQHPAKVVTPNIGLQDTEVENMIL